jgi:hypothetical protein
MTSGTQGVRVQRAKAEKRLVRVASVLWSGTARLAFRWTIGGHHCFTRFTFLLTTLLHDMWGNGSTGPRCSCSERFFSGSQNFFDTFAFFNLDGGLAELAFCFYVSSTPLSC